MQNEQNLQLGMLEISVLHCSIITVGGTMRHGCKIGESDNMDSDYTLLNPQFQIGIGRSRAMIFEKRNRVRGDQKQTNRIEKKAKWVPPQDVEIQH